jgi:hypothetical protein
MDYYNKNMACIKEHRPDLLKVIENKKLTLKNKLENINSISTKDGNKAIVVQYRSKEYRLNSSYRPIEEAKRWAKAYELTGINTVINMFGLGNGIFAKALMDKMDDSSYLLIYEPSYDIFNHTLSNYDISDILSNKKVFIFIEDVNSDEFRRVSNSLTSITNLNSQIQCVHPKYDEIFTESAIRFYKDLKDSYTSEVINTNTIVKLGRRNIDNLFNNLTFLRESSSMVELKEMIAGNVPAIIVAAGPSVEENIEELKRAKGRALIFAVDSILKFLLDSGVEPDFVVSIDPNKSTRHFTREIPITTPLITYLESNYDILKIHKGKKIFCLQNNFVEEIYKKANKTPPSVQASGSVALVAFSVCVKLGIKEIILVGQDLAYKDNKTHAGRQKKVEFNSKTDVELEGINGEIIRSRYDWHEFVMRYEDIISRYPDITVIDAKRYGAKIKGTKVMDLGLAIDKYCNKYHDIKLTNEDIKNTFSSEDILIVKEFLQSNLLTLRTIKSKIEKAIKDCDILIREDVGLATSKKYNDAMKRIGKTNKYIEEQKIYSILDAYVVALATNEMSQIFNFADSNKENNLNTYKQSKSIYEAAIEAVDYAYPKLEKLISKL